VGPDFFATGSRAGAQLDSSATTDRKYYGPSLPRWLIAIVFADPTIAFSPATLLPQTATAPDFALKDVNGRIVRLSDYDKFR